MSVGERREAIRAVRGQMWSPGRPSKTRREDRSGFGSRSLVACRVRMRLVRLGYRLRWDRDGSGRLVEVDPFRWTL